MEHLARKIPVLGIVVPCYNEQEILQESIVKLSSVLNDLISQELCSSNSFLALIDDGSKDATWDIIELAHKKDLSIKGLKLAANAGHQKALLSGLMHFKDQSDCLISIDADLQDDIAVMPEMLANYMEGKDIVYGVRKERKEDSGFKRRTALGYYKFTKRMGVNLIHNHADYRLASKRVLDSLEGFEERNLFLRGIFPSLGYTTAEVYYNRLPRTAGESKYNLRKMLSFAWDGITSFSAFPLRLVSILGLIIFCVSIGLSIYVLILYINHRTVVGWASTVLPLYFLSGIQLLCIGVLGEYIAKLYIEVKRRPRYIIEKVLE